MLSLLLYTLAMMGLTFLIGFFVAGVIKIIASWADFLDFYNLEREEILNIKKESKSVAASGAAIIRKHRSHHDRYRRLVHRINYSINGLKPRKRIVA